ncbi:MAG: Asp-tRNA(Asn)/Glu-tRNA(Gln) amidotransferase subunit GatC [Calditrichae bacterium]|nr:Asp-tRNA(Asn)/Glu-tRNA(Gln) amidotransferase subunit GatC [Calditrichota bacterium]MCB9058830.1 Asp-tRNA(Asn)/Glu-tRNA(Gln) amidotransferase subunit GatC [Calditrichia bacterium]
MSVTIQDLEKIANLARLKLNEEEKSKFLGQLNQILEYVEKLNEINTDGIEPLSHSLDLVNVLRKDIEQASLDRNKALENAPKKNDAFFRVPKVVTK